MFPLPVMLVVILIFAAIQISLWNMFPKKFRDIVFANAIVAFLLNLGGSNFIVMFTGVASMVGICNLGASVIFAVYVNMYKKKYNISGLIFKWGKLFGIVPIIPIIDVSYSAKSTCEV